MTDKTRKPGTEGSPDSDAARVISFTEGRKRLDQKRQKAAEEKERIRRAQMSWSDARMPAPARGWAWWVQVVAFVLVVLFALRTCGQF